MSPWAYRPLPHFEEGRLGGVWLCSACTDRAGEKHKYCGLDFIADGPSVQPVLNVKSAF